MRTDRPPIPDVLWRWQRGSRLLKRQLDFSLAQKPPMIKNTPSSAHSLASGAWETDRALASAGSASCRGLYILRLRTMAAGSWRPPRRSIAIWSLRSSTTTESTPWCSRAAEFLGGDECTDQRSNDAAYAFPLAGMARELALAAFPTTASGTELLVEQHTLE